MSLLITIETNLSTLKDKRPQQIPPIELQDEIFSNPGSLAVSFNNTNQNNSHSTQMFKILIHQVPTPMTKTMTPINPNLYRDNESLRIILLSKRKSIISNEGKDKKKGKKVVIPDAKMVKLTVVHLDYHPLVEVAV